MILLFPDHDTLRVALTSSIVPLDVTLAPATVTYDDQGRIYVETATSLSRTTMKNLDRIGVKGSRRHASTAAEKVASWLQIVPVVKEPGTPTFSSQTAVLFELESADDLPTLVTEMLRLGNDRQGFRWFAASDDEGDRRVLLRVVGPPYYTLLRALDRSDSGTVSSVRAYLERSPRVWVEIGRNHPLAPQIKAPEGQLILIREPRDWLFLDEAPFQDVYDILQFELPAKPVEWSPTESPSRMAVALKLTAGNAADVPELWILRRDAVKQLDTLVRDADDRLIQRLTFAVAADAQGNPVVVLRTRPSKLPPPALPLEDAVGFKPFWKLPNLFLPAGKRLHPTLRRDAVRRLLADDADQVVWLYPDDRGGFTPESVADAAFRSLEDWVEYVIESEQAELAAWIDATRFDFDHFVCKETGPKPKPDRGDKEPKSREPLAEPKETKAAPVPAKMKSKGGPKSPRAAEFLPAPETKAPSEWKIRLIELENQFIAVEGQLDAPDRQAMWPELASVTAKAGESGSEAALCWLNALWNTEPMPPEWLAEWAQNEWPAAGDTIRAEDFDRRLTSRHDSIEDLRAVVSAFLWLSSQKPVPAWLIERLPAIQKYLERREGAMPVRAVWLAAYRMSQLNGADVLGLARVRDRLLQRLLNEGLSPERDLPMFLRTAGLKDGERVRAVRERAMELHQTVRKWTEHVPVNLPYVDLLFGFALARLEEFSAARKLLADAESAMVRPIPKSWTDHRQCEDLIAALTTNILFKAFRYRVEQVIAGKGHHGPLSAELLAELETLRKKEVPAGSGTKSGTSPSSTNPFLQADYVIGRMRQQSKILEPHERLDPYSHWTRNTDALRKELASLHEIREPGKLADRIRQLYRSGVSGKSTAETRFLLLHEALPLSPRVGESFTCELLNHVPGVLAAGLQLSGPSAESAEVPRKQAELLERSLFYAAHFDRREHVQKLVTQFADLVEAKAAGQGKPGDGTAGFQLINAVGGQCLRSLRKMGLRDEIDGLLTRLQRLVIGGASLSQLRGRYESKPQQWVTVLQTLLNLAGGWLTFGLKDHADPILDEARSELLRPDAGKVLPQHYSELARAYVAALGHGPFETGLPRIAELFRKMDRDRLSDSMTTSRHYSRFRFNLVEEVILALVSDDFALGPAGRRWLDDDEYLVRRRIHDDMRRHVASLS